MALMRFSSTLVLSVGLAIFAVLLAIGVTVATRPLTAPPASPVEVSSADAATVAAASAGFVGVVVSSSTVDLSPMQDGTVLAVLARVGDVVKKGQVLVTLESSELTHDLAMAQEQLIRDDTDIERAQLERRQADERLARAQQASVHLNVEERSSAKYSAEFAATAERALAARRAQNATKVEQLRQRLAARTLRAPVDSVVSERFLDPGAVVQTGTVVLRLVGQGGWLVRFAIPEGEEAGLAPDAGVWVKVPSSGRTWPGIVTELSPSLDPASMTRLAEARLTIEHGGPPYGTVVRVHPEGAL